MGNSSSKSKQSSNKKPNKSKFPSIGKIPRKKDNKTMITDVGLMKKVRAEVGAQRRAAADRA